jgi:hypothetical protein
VVAVAMLLAAAACGYDVGATFNSDGSVTVGLKFLFPSALMQGSSTGSVSGLTPADIAKANASVSSKYPGGKVTVVTEGDQSGALVSIPFKTEKDAFAFLTKPSSLNPSGATSGTSSSINLADTGGLFASATHTTSGQNDTYTFKTQAAAIPSPSPGDVTSPITTDELASIFTVTFSLTLPHVITSAPSALFTLDERTAIWRLNWTKSETFTATTGSSLALAGFASNSAQQGQSPVLLAVVGLIAILLGFGLGGFVPWRSLMSRPATAPAGSVYAPPTFSPPTVPVAGPPPPPAPPPASQPGGFSGPPPGAAPPWLPPGS